MKINKILFTTDFSDYSLYPLNYAVDLAEKYSASLTLIHVIELIIAPVDYSWESYGVAYNVSEIEKKATEFAKQKFETILKDKIPAQLKTDYEICYGKPFREIINFAKKGKFDLIVMSTHETSGLSEIIFGTTASKVVKKSPIPVLTVRHPDHTFKMP